MLMKVSTDNMQRLKSGMLFLLEFYKVLMGTLLLVFIPQDCGSHSCSINENIYSVGIFRNIVKFYNFITLLAVFLFYVIELKRENWCIEYLDIDVSKPNNNLDEEIEKYPNIKKNMNNLNRIYYKLTLISIYAVFLNFLLYCIYIIHNNYGANTFTSLLSFGMLVLMKLFSAFNISKKSIKDEHAYSAFMKTAITFNVIDDNYIIIEKNSNNNEDTETNQKDIVLEI